MLSTLTLDMALKWWDMPPFSEGNCIKSKLKTPLGHILLPFDVYLCQKETFVPVVSSGDDDEKAFSCIS